jgi:hypothetical protein
MAALFAPEGGSQGMEHVTGSPARTERLVVLSVYKVHFTLPSCDFIFAFVRRFPTSLGFAENRTNSPALTLISVTSPGERMATPECYAWLFSGGILLAHE